LTIRAVFFERLARPFLSVKSLWKLWNSLSLVIIQIAVGEDLSWIILGEFCLVFEAWRRWLW